MEPKFLKNIIQKNMSFKTDQHIPGIAGFLFVIILIGMIKVILLLQVMKVSDLTSTAVVFAMTGIATYILFALKVASQWQKAVVLRLGKFLSLRGPGLFWIVPIVDTIPTWIDSRVMVTPFSAEKTLTKDTVPVNVDAVLFWVVWDAEKAALEVEDYRSAIAWAAQTALRDIIGRMLLADILVGRSAIDEELQHVIDERTTPWGVTVQSVRILNIVIPHHLEHPISHHLQPDPN